MVIYMLSERWGKKFIDKRDWKQYNEELVVRGEFYLDFDWVKDWDKELEKMNKDKKGAPYEFPESLIELQGVWGQWIDYRGIEGITRKLTEMGIIPKYNDFSTVNRRVNKLDTEFILPKDENVFASSDGSGMKMNNGGSYRERKYGSKRKKYIKVTITANPKDKKLLECTVEIEGEGESEPDISQKHMEKIMGNGKKIEKFLGDGSYDKKDLFDFLERNGIESAIKLPENAVLGDCDARNKEVKKYKKKGYKKWAKEKEYGIRWLGTEGIFSAVKRKFGENVRSTKIENMLKEAKRKFWAYDLIQQYPKT